MLQDDNLEDSFIRLETNIPSSLFTTFHIGGVAPYVIRASGTDDLLLNINVAQEHDIPYILISGGSNVVFSDTFPDKLIVLLSGNKIKVIGNNILCEAGIPLSQLIEKSIDCGLTGLESLSGIPGSVGGAIVGNAGAYGRAISDCLKKVLVFDGRNTRWLTFDECSFSYRESIFKKRPYVVLEAEFELLSGNKKILQKKAKDIIHLREKKYRKGIICPGSFFKNVFVDDVPSHAYLKIPKDKVIDGKIPAGYLLEQVGACGMSYGDVIVASYHGNLFINKGKATFDDLMTLAGDLKNRVHENFDIKLEEEVRIFS